MKKVSLFFSILAVFTFFTACNKDEDAPGNNGGQTTVAPKDTITSFMVSFFNTTDSTTEIGSYDDPDGPGPQDANIGGVTLQKNASYIVTFLIEDATNSKQIVNIRNKIKAAGCDYKLCISNPLGISVNATDTDGSLPIGLINSLITSSTTGNASLNFTIKYQKGIKTGDCTPGTLYYNCNLPISIL